jgi:hypothetical protein
MIVLVSKGKVFSLFLSKDWGEGKIILCPGPTNCLKAALI